MVFILKNNIKKEKMNVNQKSRTNIVNINNLTSIRAIEYSLDTDKDNAWKIVYSGSEFLGQYSSEQNAIEVLNMICSSYDDYANRGGLDKCWVKSIFLMPKDEELNPEVKEKWYGL